MVMKRKFKLKKIKAKIKSVRKKSIKAVKRQNVRKAARQAGRFIKRADKRVSRR